MAFFGLATITMVDCKFEDSDTLAAGNAIEMYEHAKVTLKNIWINAQTFQGSVIYNSDGDGLTIDGGSITSNHSWYPAINISNTNEPIVTLKGGLQISGNFTENGSQIGYQVWMESGNTNPLILQGSVTLPSTAIFGKYVETP